MRRHTRPLDAGFTELPFDQTAQRRPLDSLERRLAGPAELRARSAAREHGVAGQDSSSDGLLDDGSPGFQCGGHVLGHLKDSRGLAFQHDRQAAAAVTKPPFMVFGEPDIELRSAGEGKLVVEIRGLDAYDPTTGELRSSSIDDIAAWFLDTSYDGDAFFVRHAYFTGAGNPYDKLRRSLRADISDEAWATVNSAVSRPFAVPQTGRIAVKVVNHYGDEVMKIISTSF